MSKPTVICVTSIRNDAWILKEFLEIARTWADFIIIGNHNSTDDSIEIAKQFNCVKMITHQSNSSFFSRRKDLLREARKLPGPRLIFTLDVDEMISANWESSSDWDQMLNAPPGTRFALNWLEIYPGVKQAAIFWMPTAFLDDGTEYPPVEERIHGSRLPETSGEEIKLYDITLLHFHLLDSGRIFSKHRYYKCYEYIELGRRPWEVDVYYQDVKFTPYNAPVVELKDKWLKGYDWLDKYKADTNSEEKCFWYDEKVLDYFDVFGASKFRKLNIWSVNWNEKAKFFGRKGNYNDPRSGYEIWIHQFIEKYREGLKMKSSFPYRLVRLFARTGLRALGW